MLNLMLFRKAQVKPVIVQIILKFLYFNGISEELFHSKEETKHIIQDFLEVPSQILKAI